MNDKTYLFNDIGILGAGGFGIAAIELYNRN